MTAKTQEHPSVGVSVANLRAGYPGRLVLKDVQLCLPARQVSVILGPGGSGKTTLLRAIEGEEEKGFWWQGQIDFWAESKITTQWQEKDLSKATMAGWILPNQARPRLQQARTRVQKIWSSVPAAAACLLAALDKGESKIEPWHLALARFTGTLATPEELVLLDEPGFGLPSMALSWLATLVRETARAATVILVTHNLALARRVGDFMVLMVDGEAIETGAAEAFLNRPQRQRTRHFVQLGC